MNKKIKNSVFSFFLLITFILSGLGFSTVTQAASSQDAAMAAHAYSLYLGALRGKKTVKKAKTTKSTKKVAVKKTVKKTTTAKKVVKKTTTVKKVAKKPTTTKKKTT